MEEKLKTANETGDEKPSPVVFYAGFHAAFLTLGGRAFF